MSRHPVQVDIADQQNHITVRPRRLRRVVRRTLAREGVRQARISLAFVGDSAIRRLNRRFLSRNPATDVLSFPLSEDGGALAGEIVVSSQTAQRESRRRGTPPEGELLLYVVHGLLHLVGYDDRRRQDAQAMHRREEGVLTEFGFENVYRCGPSSDGEPSGRAD